MLAELLKKQGEIGVEAVKKAIRPYSVSKKTEESIEFESSETNLKIFAREFIETLENGRGPRKSSTYGGFDKGLEEYLKIKGFPIKKSKTGNTYYFIGESWMTAKSLAYKINKEGDTLYRKGGGRDVYSSVLEKFTEQLTDIVTKEIFSQSTDKVIQSLKEIK